MIAFTLIFTAVRAINSSSVTVRSSFTPGYVKYAAPYLGDTYGKESMITPTFSKAAVAVSHMTPKNVHKMLTASR